MIPRKIIRGERQDIVFCPLAAPYPFFACARRLESETGCGWPIFADIPSKLRNPTFWSRPLGFHFESTDESSAVLIPVLGPKDLEEALQRKEPYGKGRTVAYAALTQASPDKLDDVEEGAALWVDEADTSRSAIVAQSLRSSTELVWDIALIHALPDYTLMNTVLLSFPVISEDLLQSVVGESGRKVVAVETEIPLYRGLAANLIMTNDRR